MRKNPPKSICDLKSFFRLANARHKRGRNGREKEKGREGGRDEGREREGERFVPQSPTQSYAPGRGQPFALLWVLADQYSDRSVRSRSDLISMPASQVYAERLFCVWHADYRSH
jgi:hypothetical protein